MRHKLGDLLMALGVILFCCAIGLSFYNHKQADTAAHTSAQILPQLQSQIPSEPQEDVVNQLHIPIELLEPEDLQMTRITIDGYDYVGYIAIPALELELPVMAEWDYERLEKAPCCYHGTLRGNDLVIMGHNYEAHFKHLSDLKLGDLVTFTDMDGIVTTYQVAARDVLDATAVAEMTEGAFALTLFTCTYGGHNRLCICCDRVD